MPIIKNISQKIILNAASLFISKINNYENLPRNGSFLIVSNHASYVDPFIIISLIFKRDQRIPEYIGKQYQSIFRKWLYSNFNAITLNDTFRSNAVDVAVDRINQGKIVGIFPEGARTLNGQIQKGKTGAARIALISGARIIPIYVKGSYEIWPKSKKLPKIKKSIVINIGKPFTLRQIKEENISKKLLEQSTNRIMKNILDLSK